MLNISNMINKLFKIQLLGQLSVIIIVMTETCVRSSKARSFISADRTAALLPIHCGYHLVSVWSIFHILLKCMTLVPTPSSSDYLHSVLLGCVQFMIFSSSFVHVRGDNCTPSSQPKLLTRTALLCVSQQILMCCLHMLWKSSSSLQQDV